MKLPSVEPYFTSRLSGFSALVNSTRTKGSKAFEILVVLACLTFFCALGYAFFEDEKTNYDNAISGLWVCCITVFFLLFLVLSSTPLFNEDDTYAHGSKIFFSLFLAGAFGCYFLLQVGYYEEATLNPTVTVGTSFIPEHELESQRIQFYVTMTYDIVGVQKGNGPLQNQSAEEIVETLDSRIHIFPILTLSGEIDPEISNFSHEVRIPTFGILGTLDMQKWWNSTCDIIDGISEFDVEKFLICSQEHSNISVSIDSVTHGNLSNSTNSSDSSDSSGHANHSNSTNSSDSSDSSGHGNHSNSTNSSDSSDSSDRRSLFQYGGGADYYGGAGSDYYGGSGAGSGTDCNPCLETLAPAVQADSATICDWLGDYPYFVSRYGECENCGDIVERMYCIVPNSFGPSFPHDDTSPDDYYPPFFGYYPGPYVPEDPSTTDPANNGPDICGRPCSDVATGPRCVLTWAEQCPGEEPPSGFISTSTLYDLCPGTCGPEEQMPSECGEVCPPGYTNNFHPYGAHFCESAEGHYCAICDGIGIDYWDIDSCRSVAVIESQASQDEVQTVKSILNEGNSGKVRGLGMTLDFSNEDLIQCDERTCKFINLYLMIDQEGCDLTDSTDPSKLCEGQIYELLNMIFFSGSSTNNEQNVLQSDRRLKTKYNLLFQQETSLTKEETFQMVTSNIQYGEEPKRNTKQFVKLSFVLPKRQGKIAVSTSEAVLSYTLGSLWTTVIATFSVVSQIFLFVFPNILHKSYFRFQKWVPIVTEGKNLEEDSVIGGTTFEDFETADCTPEKRLPNQHEGTTFEDFETAYCTMEMVAPEKRLPNQHGEARDVS